ncbi:hypothetical protein AS156_04735 [Bradyrhizobium macuxiense]|uniref:Cell division and transport-associated protein TolA n=1 Tax=Bradyrhizobium macuxiense TaxID=1755647 RepID=A0A109JWD1_9BRAD|nr:hypothetical protein [Bradyrhizobium macuxiense]KWV56293.1 hypothetical protein AS156_04735 [Bradyrhizobium macuxiense]
MKFRPNADLMASVLVHLLLLALIFLYSEVHQFDPVAADTMPVEVVTPQEAAEVAPDPTPTPSPTPELRLPSLDKPTDQAAAQPEAQAPAPQPAQKQETPPAQDPPAQEQKPQPQQKQAATPPQPVPQPSPPPQQMAKAEQPPIPQQPPPAAQQPAPPPAPAYTQPEPDPSVKYHVILGLPPYLPAETSAPAPSGPDAGMDNFDAPATQKADIGTGVVAEFRRHLKSCLKLPATLSTSDDVRVKLRVLLMPDGKLAATPQLIEASASAKGPLLMQSATSALQACQPYAMLPKDRYKEWKVLDLDFTPRDFAS